MEDDELFEGLEVTRKDGERFGATPVALLFDLQGSIGTVRYVNESGTFSFQTVPVDDLTAVYALV